MGFAHLDRFAGRDSWLADHTTADQRLRIGIAVAFTAALMPSGAALALGSLGGLVLASAISARIPIRSLLGRLGHALPFLLLPLIALPLTIEGPAAVELGPLALSRPGLERAAMIGARALVAISAMTVVVSSTRAADLLSAIHRLPIPGLTATALALGYRYLYTLIDEHERTRRTLESRGGVGRGWGLWRVRAAVVAHLWIRAYQRSGRIHSAMSSRGYRDRFPTLEPERSVGRFAVASALMALGLVWVAGYLEVAVG